MPRQHRDARAHAPAPHVPELRVSDPDSVSSVPHAGNTESIPWRDNEGRIVGRGYLVDGVNVVELEGIGRFEFSPGERTVIVRPERSAPTELVHDTYRRWILPIAVQSLGFEVLHAGAVLSHGGVVAFCGASGSGKSTIAYALAQRGYSLFADDALAFEGPPDRLRALPLPFELRLRPLALAHFGLNGAAPEPADHVSGPAPMAAVFLLQREAKSPAVDPVAPEEALPALLEQSYHFGNEKGARKRAMLSAYLALATGAPILRLTVAGGLARLDETLDAVEATL